ncbi:MAG: histidinol-phosphate transaminase [Synergistaceae bacterium]|nr:histidinol-phosphate transaminase [Synergistaceae bacterium]MBR0184664.1 histidinol-phosphate transaminase [Synergistaceae bacterium]
MGKFLHTKYSSLTPYDTSGEVESMKGYIRLNTNESPFPPSPKVLSATLEASRGLNYYCDPECSQLAAKIASMYSLSPSQIVFGNGSDEILNFLFMAFCEKGAAFPNITYSFYKILAKFHGVDYIPVPLKNFRIDPSYYKDVKGRTIFIANPNAPTSLAMSLSEIEEILSSNPESLVVIDEAYVDFGAESAVTLLPEHDNLVITRTFSKSRSLAGARLGWCMTSEEIAKDIKDIKNTLTPYNINAMTQAAGLGALDDEEYTRRNIDMIRMVRDNTKSRLREMGFDVMDSSTNFLFAKHETVSGEEIFSTLKKYRIMIRHFSNPPAIADYNRITIGTPEQMQIFLEVTKGIIKQ